MDIIDLKLIIQLQIEKNEENNNNNNLYNISCKYILKNPIIIDINKMDYKDNNILINKNYNNLDLFLNNIIKIFPISSIRLVNNTISISTRKNINGILLKFPSYKTLILEEIIDIKNKDEKDNTVEYVKELNNNKYESIIAVTDNKLLRYDNFNFVNKIEIPAHNSNSKYNFCELEEEDSIKKKKKKYLSESSLKNKKENPTIISKDFDIKNMIEMKKNIFILCFDNSIMQINDLNNNIIGRLDYAPYEKKSYIGGIKINENYAAFTSNQVLSNGEDKIIFCKTSSNWKEKIEGYSFILSRNNLSIIPIPDKYNKEQNGKLLFCACKKYMKHQNNGILLLKLELSNKITIHKTFYKTSNFEVYCFCNIIKNNNNIIDRNKNDKNYSEYVLVGGFDNYKKEGLIKLYKIIYNKDITKIKLEYIQDIQIDNIKDKKNKSFKKFKGPIGCITQLSDGNILICNFDNNIYKFDKPYIEYIEQMEKDYILDLKKLI